MIRSGSALQAFQKRDRPINAECGCAAVALGFDAASVDEEPATSNRRTDKVVAGFAGEATQLGQLVTNSHRYDSTGSMQAGVSFFTEFTSVLTL
jgi:hypothetical protein